MKINFKNSIQTLGDMWHRILRQWIRHYKLLFIFAFVIVTALGVFQWYYHLESYSWTEEQKKDFLARSVKETAFQEKTFQDALSSLNELRESHEEDLPITRDLFLGKKESEK